jgi:hypothetical protein
MLDVSVLGSTIISGITADVPNRSGLGISFSFTIGQPPIRVSMATSFSPPIGSNEYVALAVRRSYWPGGGYAVLAYRRLGYKLAAKSASAFSNIAVIIVAAVWLHDPSAYCGKYCYMTRWFSIGVAVLGGVAILDWIRKLRARQSLVSIDLSP